MSKIADERTKTAEILYTTFTIPKILEKWRFLVIDSSKPDGEKTIGKFTTREDAETFAIAKRIEYRNRGAGSK